MKISGKAELPAEVLETIDARIKNGYMAGLVIGMVDESGETYHSFGRTLLPDGPAPDENTYFDTGSIGKVFTGLLLAEMIQRGELALEEPAEKYLKPPSTTPRKGGKTFSLLDLVTHRSGLPFASKTPQEDPKDILPPMLRTALDTTPGEVWNYTNLGSATLGRTLADRAGKPFVDLVAERLFLPLGMKDTYYYVPAEKLDRKARGHVGLKPTKIFNPDDYPAYRPCGGQNTTARDMVRFMKVSLGMEKSPLAGAIAMTHERRCLIWEGCHIGMIWELHEGGRGDIISHGGMNTGFCSRMAFRKSDKRGVIAMANSLCEVDDIALHLLDPGEKLKATPLIDWEASFEIPEEELVKFTGEFGLKDSEFALQVSASKGGLAIQGTGQWSYDYRPLSKDEFICPEWRGRIAFKPGKTGPCDTIISYQSNGNQYEFSRKAG